MARWNPDIRSNRILVLKGFLMLLCGLLAVALLILRSPEWPTAILLACAIFGFCRFYYFLFYVIEKYIDGSHRFSGIFDALRFLWRRQD